MKCKGGTTGYHQRILKRGDRRIPPTNFARRGHQDSTNEFCKRGHHREAPTNLAKGGHSIPPTNFAKRGPQDTTNEFWKISGIAFNCFNVPKIVENHFFDQNNVFRLIKTGYDNFNFLSSEKGGPQDTTNEFFQNFRNCIQLFQTF